MKRFLFVILSVITIVSVASCSDNDDNSYSGFSAYEGTWAPVAYYYKDSWYDCNPNYPDRNNIDRFSFIKYEGSEVIIRCEYYSNGEWKHRYDNLAIYSSGSFYKDNVGSVGEKYNIYITNDGYLHLEFAGTNYTENYKLKKIQSK